MRDSIICNLILKGNSSKITPHSLSYLSGFHRSNTEEDESIILFFVRIILNSSTQSLPAYPSTETFSWYVAPSCLLQLPESPPRYLMN